MSIRFYRDYSKEQATGVFHNFDEKGGCAGVRYVQIQIRAIGGLSIMWRVK